MPNQYNPQAPTSFGQPKQGGLMGFLNPQATDIYQNQLPTKDLLQRLAQYSSMPGTLYNQYHGYQAPDIGPVAQAEYKRLQEEILPQLAGQLTASGDQGAFLRSLRGAGGDIATKLAALQYEKQHEMNRLRQEQIPRFREMELSPTYQTFLSNMPVRGPEYTPTSSEKGLSAAGKEATNIAKEIYQGAPTPGEIGAGIEKGVKGGLNFINDTTMAGLEKALPKQAFDFIKKQNDIIKSRASSLYKTQKEAVGKPIAKAAGTVFEKGKEAAGRLAEAYQKGAKKEAPSARMPAPPPNAEERTKNVVNTLDKSIQKDLAKDIYPFLSKSEIETLNKIAKDDKRKKYLPMLKHINSPQRFKKWIDIVWRTIRSSQIERKMKRFMEQIGAENA